MSASYPRVAPPQSFISSYAPRLRGYANALLTPIIEKPTAIPPIRTTKRGTALKNYAEDGFGSELDDEDEAGRRFTGLRSRRDDGGAGFGSMHAPSQDKASHYGREVHRPVDVQGIWREWMGKPRPVRTERQAQVQCALPLMLIPIRIDVDITPFRPEAPLPTPPQGSMGGMRIDENLPAYRQQEITPGFRIKDVFLWNLWESLITPDQFARVFVDDLDLEQSKKSILTLEIARQIREQLEQHASTVLHPLFQSEEDGQAENVQAGPETANGGNTVDSPMPHGTPSVTAVATPALQSTNPKATDHADTHRCILHLSINLQSNLYTDRVEWSLLHPAGVAETFARQTCADVGLPAEWATPIAHAIYESVLRLKKEAAETGGAATVYHAPDGAVGTLTGAPLDNDAANEFTGAGWRYEPESLAAEWAPRVEALSKEEIEKREGDRERRLRRARRETARMGDDGGRRSTMLGGGGGSTPGGGDMFGRARGFGGDEDEGAYGRGERSRKKRRYRSLSPGGRDTPDSTGPGGGGLATIGALSEPDRARWRCDWCKVWGAAVWGTKDGPEGPNTLCHNCGYILDRDKRLPPWSENMYSSELPAGAYIRR